jgi:hypothetical protein
MMQKGNEKHSRPKSGVLSSIIDQGENPITIEKLSIPYSGIQSLARNPYLLGLVSMCGVVRKPVSYLRIPWICLTENHIDSTV